MDLISLLESYGQVTLQKLRHPLTYTVPVRGK